MWMQHLQRKPSAWRTTAISAALLYVPVLLLLASLVVKVLQMGRPAEFHPCDGIPQAECKLHVPKIIHQTYKTTKIPNHWMMTPEM